MKKFLIFFALVIASQAPFAAPMGADGARLEYTVAIEKPEAHTAHIKLVISNIGGENSLRFHIYKPEGYDERYVENLSVASEGGFVSSGLRAEGFAWVCEIATEGAAAVTIEYDTKHLIPSKGVRGYGSYIGPDFSVIDTSYLFLIPTYHPISEIRISFKVPENWESLTTWDGVDGKYRADGVKSLGWRYIILGPSEKSEGMANGVEIITARFNEVGISLEGQLQGLGQLTNFYSRTFGFVPADKLLWAIVPSDIVLGGRAAANTFLLSEGLSWSVLGYEFWKTAAHEYCHLWNGWVVGFKEDARWFLEGGANYFADLALLDTNLCQRSKLEIFEAWGDYKSVKEAGIDKAVAEASDPFEDSIWIYKKGELVTYLLNKRIEETTDGRKNIYDLARYLFQNYQGRSLGTNDILTAANAVTGRDLSDFFSSYVYGTEKLPLDELGKWEMAVPKIPGALPEGKADFVSIAIAAAVVGCVAGAVVLFTRRWRTSIAKR